MKRGYRDGSPLRMRDSTAADSLEMPEEESVRACQMFWT